MQDAAKAGVIAGAGTNEYKVVIKDDGGNTEHETSFNFTRSSSKYIRKVFNTNPTLVNDAITRTAQQETYWLGPTFEKEVASVASGDSFGVILGLDNDSATNANAADFRFGFQAAQTPWIISQDLQSSFSGFNPENMTKLFKFHTLDAGEDEQKKVKVSIVDVKASTTDADPYGSFSVEVRDARDSDNAPAVIDRDWET